MTELPIEIYPVGIVREIDRCAIEGHRIPGYELMNRAAAAAFDEARRSYPAATDWLVLAGPGNNAGDAYVLARLAAADGVKVTVLALADPRSLSGDAATAARDYADAGGRVERARRQRVAAAARFASADDARRRAVSLRGEFTGSIP